MQGLRRQGLRRILGGAILACLACALLPQSANAQFVIDAQTNALLHQVSLPIIKAAGLDPASVEFVLLDNPSANAFVVGGQTVYLHTGLFILVESLPELMGVIAHEMGHIAGGHYVRRFEHQKDLRRLHLLQVAAGFAAAIIAGNAEVAAGSVAAAQSSVLDQVIQHSRATEFAADQAALRFMDQAGYSAKGLQVFFNRAAKKQRGLPDPYWSTHPPSKRRLEVIDRHIAQAAPAADFSPEQRESFDLIRAKIMGFAQPKRALKVYKGTGKADRYARAVALWRTNQPTQALEVLHTLVAAAPDDSYFHELIGQISLELGDYDTAQASYEKALVRHRTEPSFLIPLAHTLLVREASNDRSSPAIKRAIRYLSVALQQEDNLLAHRLLATAYGQTGREPEAMVHLAYEAFFLEENDRAKALVEGALERLSPGSVTYLKAQDLQTQLEAEAA